MIKYLLTLSILVFSAVSQPAPAGPEEARPNVIIIFTDDQGYQDLGCYGSPLIETPHLDQMATEGIRLTNFYVTASICSPSRASLLTGRYPAQHGVGGVFFPDARGMAPQEVTMAEVVGQAGYRTACFGKWHLGDRPATLPTAQGFDVYFGIPYSNDMYIGADQDFAEKVNWREGYSLAQAQADQALVKQYGKQRKFLKEKGIKELVPLFEGKKIVEYPAEQATLTQRYFERAMEFIDEAQSAEEPFFIYLTPAMPHVPLYASDSFKGKSKRGIYGDVIEEIDHYVGELMGHLRAEGLEEETMVIFTSDNGPWLNYEDLAGSALPLRDGKFSRYEGGVRVPCILRWPGTWSQGITSDEVISTLDFLPTVAHYAGSKTSSQALDGRNISSHLETATPLAAAELLYSRKQDFWGIRQGEWKYLTHGGSRKATQDSLPELFNLKADPSESQNLMATHPEVAARLAAKLEAMQQDSK
ncbi:MAG: sulfatase [Bacteroidota bacterium]